MVGKLIVFEGGEGSGKTTQMQKLRDWLLGQVTFNTLQKRGDVKGLKLTREPGGTALGKAIRQLLLTPQTPAHNAQICSNTELLLYAADRAQHVEETILPWLEAGYWILCDRFTDSTVAYQGYGRQLNLELIHQLNTIATGGLKSDLTLWLNVSPKVGLNRMRQRGEADRLELAGGDFHQRVWEGFETLAKPTSKSEAKPTSKLEAKPSGTSAAQPISKSEAKPSGALASGSASKQINPYSSGPTVEIDGDRALEAVSAQIQNVIKQRIEQWYPHLFLN